MKILRAILKWLFHRHSWNNPPWQRTGIPIHQTFNNRGVVIERKGEFLLRARTCLNCGTNKDELWRDQNKVWADEDNYFDIADDGVSVIPPLNKQSK